MAAERKPNQTEPEEPEEELAADGRRRLPPPNRSTSTKWSRRRAPARWRRCAIPFSASWPRRAGSSGSPRTRSGRWGGRCASRATWAAARKLVVHNLRLVITIAYQYRRAWANILDLFQEGSVGLMEAVKRWEPSLGPRFGTYAAYWIRAYVLRFLMTNSRLIHVGNTRAGRKLFFRLEKERQKLLAAGFEPTPKLLAANLDVDEKELDEVRQHLESREVSIDPRGANDAGDETYALSERIAAGGDSPEVEAEHAEMADALHDVHRAVPRTLEGRPRARRLAGAPGDRRAGGAGRAGRAVRGLEAAHGADRRPAEEAVSNRDRREVRSGRPHRLARLTRGADVISVVAILVGKCGHSPDRGRQ